MRVQENLEIKIATGNSLVDQISSPDDGVFIKELEAAIAEKARLQEELNAVLAMERSFNIQASVPQQAEEVVLLTKNEPSANEPKTFKNLKNEIETEEGIGQDFLAKNMGTSIGIKENIMPGDYGNKILTVKSGRPIKPMTAAENEQTNSNYKVFNQHPTEDKSVQINPQRKEVPIMQAPENNKITYKYVYKYGNHTEHLGNAQMDKPETNEDYGKPGSSHDIISVILSIWFILPAIITEIAIQSSFRGGIIITLTIIGAVIYSYFTHHWKTQPSNHPVKTQTSIGITLA